MLQFRLRFTFRVSSVRVAEWPLTTCSLCLLTICVFVISRFGFEGWIWVLIASVPGLCILLTFIMTGVVVLRTLQNMYNNNKAQLKAHTKQHQFD